MQGPFMSYLLNDVEMDNNIISRGTIVTCDIVLENSCKVVLHDGTSVQVPLEYISHVHVTRMPKTTRNLDVLMTIFKGVWKARKIRKRTVRMAKERKNIIMECIESESKYLDSLRVMKKLSDLLLEEKYIKTDQQEEIFGDVLEVMSQCETPIVIPSVTSVLQYVMIPGKRSLESPKRVKSQYMEKTFGEAFKTIIPSLRLCFPYINNQICAANAVKKLLDSNPSLNKFLTHLRSSNSFMKGHEIRGLLIKPAQRLPRYQLLLESVLLNTPQDHYDFENISESFSMIVKMNQDLNLKQSLSETQKILNSLRGRFPLISLESIRENSPERQFVKKGKFYGIFSSSLTEEWELYDIFLFTDLILMDLAEKIQFEPEVINKGKNTSKLLRDLFGGSGSSTPVENLDSMSFRDENMDKQVYLSPSLISIDTMGSDSLKIKDHMGNIYVLQQLEEGQRDTWFSKITNCVEAGKESNLRESLIEWKRIEEEKLKQISKMNDEIKEIVQKYATRFSLLKTSEETVRVNLLDALRDDRHFYDHFFPKYTPKFIDYTNFDVFGHSINKNQEEIKKLKQTMSFYRINKKQDEDPQISPLDHPSNDETLDSSANHVPRYKGGKIRRKSMVNTDENK